MLVGIYIDPQFAVDTFHTNIGWMLFLVFFIIYWHFGSQWVYKKKPEELASSKKGSKKSSKKKSSTKKTTKTRMMKSKKAKKSVKSGRKK